MPDPTPPAPAPAHPWRKTARTALAGVITAALLLPLAIEAAGIDITAQGWRWLGGVLAVLAAVTRVLAVPQVNALLTRVGLGHDDVEAGQVLLLRSPEEDGRVVAGEASPIPTGQAVPPNVPVRVVVDGGAVNGSIAVTAAAVLVAAIAALVYILGHVNLQGRPVPDVRRNLQDAPYPVILEDLVSKLRALSSELQGHGH